MGMKEKIKKGEITKEEALKIVAKWKEKQPWNIQVLDRLANWIKYH